MRSPLGPSLANACVAHNEKNSPDRYPLEYRLYHPWHVDDKFDHLNVNWSSKTTWKLYKF